MMGFRQKNTSFVKYFCWLGIFAFFILIFLQQLLDFKKMKPLSGDFVPTSYSILTTDSWFTGAYQTNTNKYLNDAFGFRNYFLRFNNQLRFWLFKKASAKDVVIGKNNYMYVQGYINGYFGLDFIGEKRIQDTVANLKFLQDTLKAMGKTLLVVMAPGKPRIYPEFLPAGLPGKEAGYSNYSIYIDNFKKAGINYIDFNALFKIKKASSPYLLYPQLGVHWSRLEAVRAFDTIVGQLAALSGANLPRIKITKITDSDSLEKPDEDIIEGMNLFRYPKYEKMAYPEFEYQTEGKENKNLLLIGDSYWWDIYLRGLPRNVFWVNNFWYYNKEAWSNSFLGKKSANELDISRAILQNDYIILLCGESNYGALGFGFVGAAKNSLKRKIFPTSSEINELKACIKNIPTWNDQLPDKAKARNITSDSMLTLDAIWLFSKKGPVIKKITVQEVKNSIALSPDWVQKIQKHAEEVNISLDSAKTEAAIWFFNSELRNKEKEIRSMTLDEVKASIRNNKNWMNDIIVKAKKENRSVELQIEKDAKWYMDEMARKN